MRGGQLITRALAAPTSPGANPAGCSPIQFDDDTSDVATERAAAIGKA